MTGPGGTVEGFSAPDLIDDSSVGIFAVHAVRATLPVQVAPTTDDAPNAFNTIRDPLVTIGCANLPDDHFAFDSSVLAASSIEGFKKFGSLLRRNPGAPAGLWGHADPEGADLYNKFLSERRARAVYAALRRDTAMWEALYENPEGAGGDVWGTRSIQTMLAALEDFDAEVDGKDGPLTRAAIEKFQSKHTDEHPGPKGINSPAFRKVLFKAYMNFLCRRPVDGDPSGPEALETYEMAATDFLSRGEGKLRGDFQGCSFFNPQLVLSQSEIDALADNAGESKEVRHAAHAPDRRVIVFLFRPGTQIDAAHWPCPRASEGVQGCIDRFWSDGKARMGTRFTEHRRRFGGRVPISRAELVPPNPELALRMARAETTFGCRFYHGLAVGSACERDLKVWLVRLMIYARPDDNVKRKKAEANQVRRVPLANARYVVTAGEAADAAVVRGTTTADGVMMIPLFDEEAKMVLRVDAYEALFGPVFHPADETPPPAPSTTDPDAFPDEGDFLTIRLGGGALVRALKRGADQDPDFDPDDPAPEKPEADLGAEQRLFNLGFGPPVLADWGPEELAAAVKAFKQEQAATEKERADATGELDDATRAKIVQVYGS